MSLTVFAVVILAAILHASWNAMVKHGNDKFLSMSCVIFGHMMFGFAALFFVPLPDLVSWPYVLVGAVLHTGYQLFLLYSYRIGDLTQVYPIARGVAPLIIAFVSVVFLGVDLSGWQLLGVLFIGAGIMSLVMVRGSEGLGNSKAGLMALVTGCFIASYSLNDGLGARVAMSAVGFYAVLTIINGAMFFAIMAKLNPAVIKGVWGQGRKVSLLGGGGSFIAYALVTWAFTQAPIAMVSALRETSIVFALLIGVVFLKERVRLMKVFAVMMAMIGAVLVKVAR